MRGKHWTTIGLTGALGAAWSVWVVVVLAPIAAVRLLLVCVVPAVIYVPVRLALGGPALPPRGQRLTALFASLLVGYVWGVGVLFVVGCLTVPIGLFETFTGSHVLSWIPETLAGVVLPSVGAAFTAGVASVAATDVRQEPSR
jgi:hypothetical protein